MHENNWDSVVHICGVQNIYMAFYTELSDVYNIFSCKSL